MQLSPTSQHSARPAPNPFMVSLSNQGVGARASPVRVAPMRRKLRKTLRWFLVLVAAACVALVLGTLVPRPLLDPGREQRAGDPPHPGAGEPDPHRHRRSDRSTRRLREFAFLRDAGLPVDHPDARWMLFGWGSRAYYMATPELSDSSFGPLFKALTLDASVMHVEILGALDETASGGLELRRLAKPDSSACSPSSARASPRRTAHRSTSKARITATNDGFFEANGSFNALLGCNTWTAAALRQAGLRTGWWNPLPETLAYSLALHN